MEPKYRNVSIDQQTMSKIDTIRHELMEQFKKEHGIPMNISIAETIRIAIKYYADRRQDRSLDPRDISKATVTSRSSERKGE